MAALCKNSVVLQGHARRLVSPHVIVLRKLGILVPSRHFVRNHFRRSGPFSCKYLTVSAARRGTGSSSSQRTDEFFKPTDTLSDASGTGYTVTTSAVDATNLAGYTVTTSAVDATNLAGDTVTTSAVDATNLAEIISSSSSTQDAVDLSSLGLGGYWPSGLIQSAMELLYNNIHLPWWGCVVALTVMLRMATLPLNVKMQVLSAKLANTNKEAKVYHAKMEECKAAGDQVGASQAGVEIFKMYEREGVNPMMMFPLAIAQAPVFLAMFRGLRGMAVVPVESLQTGGALWFVDLALPDPYFGLPLIACVSFLANLQVRVYISGCSSCVLYWHSTHYS